MITLEQKAKQIKKKKDELGLSGYDYVPINDGKRRTQEKQALLDRLELENIKKRLTYDNDFVMLNRNQIKILAYYLKRLDDLEGKNGRN